MTTAITLVAIFVVSFTIVRIASIAMRLTGLAQNVATFQCISALSGTGFTTSESEMIVNYPVRRRILIVLMLFGNLGLVSVLATFTVSFIDAEKTTSAILILLGWISGAIALVWVLATNQTLDRVLCGAVEHVLRRTTSFGERRFLKLLQLDDGSSVSEHVYREGHSKPLHDFEIEKFGLVILGVRGAHHTHMRDVRLEMQIHPGDVLICAGRDDDQIDFEEALNP